VATPLSFTGSHLVQHRRRLAVAVTALVLLAPGCSDGASKDGAVGRVRERIGGAIRDALEEARERNEQQAGEVDRRSRDEPTEPEIGSNENVEFDYDEYQTLITSVLSSLEEYWAEALPPSSAPGSPGRRAATSTTAARKAGRAAATSRRRPTTRSTAPPVTSSPGTRAG
jgi:hypothetical protein